MGPLKDSRSSMLPRGWSKAVPGPPSFPAHLLVSPLFSLIFHFPFLTPLLIFHHLSPLPDCRMVILHFLQPAAAPTFSAVLTVQQKKLAPPFPSSWLNHWKYCASVPMRKGSFFPIVSSQVWTFSLLPARKQKCVQCPGQCCTAKMADKGIGQKVRSL